MAEILKPTNLSLTWASGGDVLDPGTTKYATGWSVEIPPRQWFNYLDNRQDTALAHINQHGVVAWDNTTEYQEDKSYVQGKTNGTIYRCIQTHTNQDPELDVGNVYWIVAFASAGDFYTKAETGGLYLAKTQNLADLTNTATARTNLSVYSQAQTYNKSEVDAKTTVASVAQAQAQTSDAVLLSALKLASAFQGSNQSFSNPGYQKLPGGLIIQWGLTPASAINTILTVNYPTPFITNTFCVLLTYVDASIQVGAGRGSPHQVGNYSNTSFNYSHNGTSGLAQFFWVAIGK